MAEKRKAHGDVRPSKKAKVSSKPDSTAKRTPQTKRSDERRPPSKSVLIAEEKSFPRGGASVLTPLEQKQIQAQAERDVLYEQSTGQKAPRLDDGVDDDLFDEKATSKAAVKKRRKDSKTNAQYSQKADEAGIRIQGLSFKNLVPGSLVLGRVTAVTSKDIALALPNNLTGFVPITSVSSALNTRIATLLNDDDSDGVDQPSDDDTDDDIDLPALFRIGQWLRAVVSEPSIDAQPGTSAQKHHLELSLDPAQVNSSLTFDQIATNAYIQASVRSVEDHGVIMDLGLANDNVHGFIGKKELGADQDIRKLSVGQVMLCLVTGKGGNGKVLKLSSDTMRFAAFGSVKQTPILTELPDVSLLLPGTAVDILIVSASSGGVTGKVMGLLDVTADIMHSGVGTLSDELIAKKYSTASKVRGRVIWSLPKDDGSRRVGVSLRSHLISMPPTTRELGPNVAEKARLSAASLEEALPASSIVERGTIVSVSAERGVYLDLELDGSDTPASAYAHISQLSDSRIVDIKSDSGPYKVGSVHRVRILNFNPVDALYHVSLRPSVLEQSFLRLEDIQVGSLVEGTIERLILGKGAQGVTGILVKLARRITALVPSTHMSDAPLQHPEKKFREGFNIKGRVLSVDLDKRQVRVSLKKSLVSCSDDEIWKDYSQLSIGQEAKGTIVKLLDGGAVVQYFGAVRAFLPVSEMSDAFVQSAAKHFRLGQTVTTRILSVDADTSEMKVSCRSAGQLDQKTQEEWDKLSPGQIISVSVSSVLADKVEVELEGGIVGVIRVGHLLDGSASKAETRLKKLRVGQRLNETLILSRLDRAHQIVLTYKPSLVGAAQKGGLPTSFDTVKAGTQVHGFVQNIMPEGVYVEFAGRTVGLLSKSQLTPDMLQQPAFGLRKDQSISVWVARVDGDRSRISLSMKEPSEDSKTGKRADGKVNIESLENPADSTLTTTADLTLNKITKARVASVKSSQINVRLADGIHGRIDVSEVFDSWDDIANHKTPLHNRYKVNQVIEVKVLGTRDSKGWRFLPFSHRGNVNAVVELSAKRSRIDDANSDLLGGLTAINQGEDHVGYINNIANDCVWVSLSPAVRGRIAFADLTHNISQLQNVQKHYPVGSAIQVKVKSVSADSGRLDLVAINNDEGQAKVTLESLATGDIVSARVTKVTEHSVTVQLSNDLAVGVPLVELSDSFDEADPTKFSKHDIVRARVIKVDMPNKRVSLSLRPSLVLSSSLPVKDKHVTNQSMLKSGSLVRGFVKHIGEKSILVSLSGIVDAFVPVSDLSDDYIKDWQSHFELFQLVKGRIISVDPSSRSVHLSLKKSHVDDGYTPPLTMEQITAGMIVTGTARKIEDFGVFVDIDNTRPRVSGLAHRSEIADKRVNDVRGLYKPGDRVKAKVLKVDQESRKINLGLKASYFADEIADDAMSVDSRSDVEDVSMQGLEVLDELRDVNSDGDIELDDASDDDDAGLIEGTDLGQPGKGLTTSGFDWSGNPFDVAASPDDDSDLELASKSKRRTTSEIKVDLTGDLDKHGPRTTDDFERLLLGQSNDSSLWIQYMAFHLQLSEIQRAREIAERALRTIHIRETEEKANIWIALINLEAEYGDEDSVEAVFKKACQMQDPLEMHERLASIYIDSGKQDKADKIFERIIANKTFRASPDVWLNYATFLMAQLQQTDRARALLSRALQSIPQSEHRLLTAKFAALEFRIQSGDAERGRTIFEALVTEWPRWTAAWDMWVDIERSRLDKLAGDAEQADEAKDKVRQLYERMSRAGMKKRRAKFVFKKWLDFEEQAGSVQGQDKVKTLAKEYVEQLQARNDADEE